MLNELKGKRLLVLGGNDWKKDIEQFCKENGIIVVAAGNDPSSSICNIADEYYNIDSTDNELMKNLIKEKKIDGVFSCSSEAVIPHSIQYSIESGLYSYATLQQWNTLMNKKHMKKVCRQYGIDVIPEYTLTNIENNSISYPVIVKPADSSGSIGISVCHNNEELKKATIKAIECSVSHDMLIEKYIVSPFWQMEIYIQNGIPYLGFTKERVFYPSVDGQAKQPILDIYPSRYDDRIRGEVFPKFSKMITDLGVKNASIWVQGFITHSHVYVFDIGFRLGGGMENRLMSIEKGIDNIKSHIAFALTGEWLGDYSKCREPFKKKYVTVCVGLKNGTIGQIDGIEQLRKSPYIFDIIQYYDKGDLVTKSGLYKQSMFRVYVKDYPGNLMDLIEMVYGNISIIDINGKEMLLPINNLEWDNELPI